METTNPVLPEQEDDRTLNIKEFPAVILRRAKATAALADMTLKDFVVAAVDSYVRQTRECLDRSSRQQNEEE